MRRGTCGVLVSAHTWASSAALAMTDAGWRAGPLSYTRIKLPARGIHCRHLQVPALAPALVPPRQAVRVWRETEREACTSVLLPRAPLQAWRDEHLAACRPAADASCHAHVPSASMWCAVCGPALMRWREWRECSPCCECSPCHAACGVTGGSKQCFDLNTFLEFARKHTSWLCPCCSKPLVPITPPSCLPALLSSSPLPVSLVRHAAL